jgi:hypothetical protein
LHGPSVHISKSYQFWKPRHLILSFSIETRNRSGDFIFATAKSRQKPL